MVPNVRLRNKKSGVVHAKKILGFHVFSIRVPHGKERRVTPTGTSQPICACASATHVFECCSDSLFRCVGNIRLTPQSKHITLQVEGAHNLNVKVYSK